MHGLHYVIAAFTLISDELHVMQYASYYSVFEMLNVDKMEHLVALECKRMRSFSKLIEYIIKMPKTLMKR